MANTKPGKPDVMTYGDHEVITPDTSKLRKTLRPAQPGEVDPVQQAEQALAAIASDFEDWMGAECERLDAARRKARQMGLTPQTRLELFLAAHDIKGDSSTLGYPEVVTAADSLCRLLEHAPDLRKVPMAIVDQHVDAVRAIVREHSRPDISNIATALTHKLRTVTDEFLLKENVHRPEVLKTLRSPSLVPGEF